MASGDNIESIEVLSSNLALNMNNSKEPPGICEPGASGEADDKDNISVLNKSIQDGGEPKSISNAARTRAEREKDRERKIGHRRVGVGGEITYKKIQTTTIMGSIQLGIQHAVGGLASKPERDLLMQDFMTVETTNFPSEGSNHTPAHHYSDFKYKNYAPIAFRYFRDLFGIQPDDFLMSMCDTPLRELSNPGASGSIFYLTSDDEFIIKTVQHKEGEFLQKLLPGYYMNLNQNPRTLLPKFFGLYCYQCNSKNVRLVIMNNLLPSNVVMHQKYDLKGSTYKRKASKAERQKRSPTYKDLDFMEHHSEGIFMESDTYNALMKTIQRDCRVLESFKIMDYSLLLAIHNLDQAQREKLEKKSHTNLQHLQQDGDNGGPSSLMAQEERDREKEDRIGAAALNRSRSINRQRLVAHSTAMESIQAESEPIDEDDDTPVGGIPARNDKGERLLLFIGIIDILQSYRLKKKLEHTWKSMIHDGDTVSVHRPSFYAQRFQKFMAEKVFKKIPSPLKHSPSKRKSLSKPLRHEELLENTSPTEPVPSTKSAPPSYQPPITTTSASTAPMSPAYNSSSSTALTSPPAIFPAVLVGSKQKVPPPVPPRGTPKPKRVDLGGKGVRVCLPKAGVFELDVQNRSSLLAPLIGSSCVVPSPSLTKGHVRRVVAQFNLGSSLACSSNTIEHAALSGDCLDMRSPRAAKQLLKYDEIIALGVVPSCCSTPPPTYSEGFDRSDAGSTIGSVSGHASLARGSRHHTGHHHSSHHHVKHYKDDSVSYVSSITDIKLVSRAETKSSLSVESGGSSTAGGHSSSGGHSSRTGLAWTPPTSVEGSTPTWTEGTPSFTESSSSGDMGCPTTPLRPGSGASSNKHHKKTVEHAINCLTTEMLCATTQLPEAIGGLEGQVIYLNTNKNFSSTRLKEVAGKLIKRSGPLMQHKSEEDILSNVFVFNVNDVCELFATTIFLGEFLKTKSVKLVIIDSIAHPLRAANSTERITVTYKLLDGFQKLSRAFNFAVVITNDFTTRVKNNEAYYTPSFGDGFFERINSRICLSKQGNVHTAELVKSVVKITLVTGEDVCYKETCQKPANNYRFLFYDVNPSEGFNLRRDVYMRMAVLANKLKNSQDPNLNSFLLVLPPWSHLMHWPYSEEPEHIPWSMFFDINSLNKFAPVIELHQYFALLKKQKYTKCILDEVYVLQHFEDMFESGNFEEKWLIEKCQKPPKMKFFYYANITASNIKCLSFHGPATKLAELFKLEKSRTLMLERAEVALHDTFGNDLYWKARRSMRFNRELRKVANDFRIMKLDSNDEDDLTTLPPDWRDEKVTITFLLKQFHNT
ncbi:hypothetical protein HUJ04_004855 [Dendroctonus ponderosae]|nr:hypothetical protein HUJ04_004855 [Dendroctonus ponderosae]